MTYLKLTFTFEYENRPFNLFLRFSHRPEHALKVFICVLPVVDRVSGFRCITYRTYVRVKLLFI